MAFSKDEVKASMKVYAISDRHWLKEGQSLAEVVDEVLKAGARFLQIREKDLDEKSFYQEASDLKNLATKYKVPFVVNDNIEIAKKIGADGVHLGQSDLIDGDIKEILGKGKILGISANTIEQALDAQKRGADYIGVGAIFSTSTKVDAKNISLAKLKEIVDAVDIPVVAIGGISRDNILSFKGTGIDGVAVVSAIFGAENPALATKDLVKLVEEVINE